MFQGFAVFGHLEEGNYKRFDFGGCKMISKHYAANLKCIYSADKRKDEVPTVPFMLLGLQTGSMKVLKINWVTLWATTSTF